ncbi:uncharacterized protein LOC143300408 [Babylonia areolata]|uniref:uncharacterized protein LOC143300408 n=1 Tax=Babylonia areolata TaxID=304850 RepID=UPI003FD02A0D
MTSSQKRIMLWAVPRSMSSAMCRVMLNSGLDTQILFEFYGDSYYFGPERISDRYRDTDPDPTLSFENNKRKLELPYADKELVFAKDMPYYLQSSRLTADWIPDGYVHTFITRHPRSTMASYFRVIDKHMSAWGEFDPREFGFKEQVDVLHLLQQQGHRVTVIDADDLMADPEGMLRAYCREVGLEYRDSMMNWAPISEEDFSAIFCRLFEDEWFLNVKSASKLNRKPKRVIAESEPFAKYDQETRDLIETTIAENIKYFEELHNMRLTV